MSNHKISNDSKSLDSPPVKPSPAILGLFGALVFSFFVVGGNFFLEGDSPPSSSSKFFLEMILPLLP
jgi:hypothetical protein